MCVAQMVNFLGELSYKTCRDPLLACILQLVWESGEDNMRHLTVERVIFERNMRFMNVSHCCWETISVSIIRFVEIIRLFPCFHTIHRWGEGKMGGTCASFFGSCSYFHTFLCA